MVSAVSNNAGMMPVMLGMGSDPKKIADKIFAKLDSETIGMLNAPDNAGARHASAETAVTSDAVKSAASHSKQLSAAEWKERARAVNEDYERQMQQINVAQGGHSPSGSAKPPVQIQVTPATTAERSSTEFHALLASFVTPADANGDGKVTSKESLVYTAELSSPVSTKSAIAASRASAARDHQSEQSLQSYRAVQEAPVGWAASATVGLAA